MNEKYERLLKYIKGLGHIAVALSGGVDSGFLLHAAVDAVGSENVAALTATTLLHRADELDFSRELAARYGVAHRVIELDPLAIEAVRFNRIDRCYHCKRAIFTALWDATHLMGIENLADGTNADDTGVYRPGLAALAELGVVSPLKECGLTKAEIRDIAGDFGLNIAKKPSRPCLATRLPYDVELEPAIIHMIAEGEKTLEGFGLNQFRLRHHGDIARIEAETSDFAKILELRKELTAALKALGYRHITLDLQGFRSGSFDEKPQNGIE